jgi:IclR family KDG regulon transcriptional repressor
LAKAKESTGSNHVKSVLKAFLVMDELDSAGELSIGEISERLSMDKGTVHRIVNTIKEAGYVIQNQDNKKYANSIKLLAMGNRVLERTGIQKIARPYMKNIWDKTGETVNVGMMVDGNIIYIDKIESKSPIKVGQGIGTKVPIHCTGMGKVILAFTPEPEKNNILNNLNLERYTPHTFVSKNEFEENINEIMNNGYAIDDEEYVVGLICIAAPIFNHYNIPIAAISISCPKYRFKEDHHKELFSTLIKEAAASISRQIGCSPD